MFGLMLATAMAASMALVSLTPEALAGPLSIQNDAGGQVLRYARKARRLRDSGSTIRFDGPCYSACTLYLSLASDRMCVTSRAKFGFHRPSGGSAALNRAMTDLMMERYPDWVTDWLRQTGGLTSAMKTMSYDYARRFIRAC